ncbi:MAG: hypothetical protein WCK88_02095 [bacterium]
MIVEKYKNKIHIELVVQSIEKAPTTYTQSRTKPWGTAHAVWCARDIIQGPFIVINADDFYGREALKQAYTFLLEHE